MFGRRKKIPRDLVEKTAQKVRDITTLEYHELFYLLRNPKKLLWLNFLVGLSRGLGLAIGLTVLGGFFITVLTVLLKKAISVPVLGQYIIEIIQLVKANTTP